MYYLIVLIALLVIGALMVNAWIKTPSYYEWKLRRQLNVLYRKCRKSERLEKRQWYPGCRAINRNLRILKYHGK